MNDYYLTGRALTIGNTPQLLADEYMVEDRWKLTRRVGTVVKHPGNPILVKDKPWEGDGICNPCVLYDEQAGGFRMWYVCCDWAAFHTTSRGILAAENPGYYVACACDEIWAHKSTVTGSIGVLIQFFDFSGTIEKIGMTAPSITSGPNKDAGSPFKSLSPEQRELFQAIVDGLYEQFIEVVKSLRRSWLAGVILPEFD